MKAPDKIYLQIYDDRFGEGTLLSPSWCQIKINDTDVEYIRADLAKILPKPGKE